MFNSSSDNPRRASLVSSPHQVGQFIWQWHMEVYVNFAAGMVALHLVCVCV